MSIDRELFKELSQEKRFRDLDEAMRNLNRAILEAVARCEKAAEGQNATADYGQFLAPVKSATAKIRMLTSRFPTLRDRRA